MDMNRIIDALIAEKERLEQVIAGLKETERSGEIFPAEIVERRGRKFMDPKERQEVSKRMMKYWDGRRKADRKPKL